LAGQKHVDEAYFTSRLPPDPRRETLWRTLCEHYFARYIASTDRVLELGAGYGHFINNVVAKRRIAVDAWGGFLAYLDPEVESHVGHVADLHMIPDDSVDFAFASNLFEHITQEDFAIVLCQLRRILSQDGTLTILQPNYYYAFREYFDDYTHRTIYTHTSICDFLRAHDFDIIDCEPRFLPLTVKSRLPVSPLLIRCYLSLPFKPFGKQMLVRCRPR
jgi:SAM-dependent methyltransferase